MTLRRGDRVVVVALVSSFCFAFSFGFATPLVARADDTASAGAEEAASHFRRGVALYKDGDYSGALVEFRRAQQLSPNYRVLFDIGQSLYQLQRYAEALKTFEDYVAQGGKQLTPARRTAVEEELTALRSRVGYLEITVSTDGAEVRVDDQLAGTSPLAAPVLVSVGHRKITVRKGERTSVERFVDVAGGDHAKVALDLSVPSLPVAIAPSPLPASHPAPPPPLGVDSLDTTSPPPPESHRSSLGWVPWTITGVLAAGTAVTGVLALTSKSRLSSDLSAFPGNPNTIANDRSQAKTFAIASDALLAATAVSAGVALYVTFRHHAAPSPSAASVGAEIRVGLDGVYLGGAF